MLRPKFVHKTEAKSGVYTKVPLEYRSTKTVKEYKIIGIHEKENDLLCTPQV